MGDFAPPLREISGVIETGRNTRKSPPPGKIDSVAKVSPPYTPCVIANPRERPFLLNNSDPDKAPDCIDRETRMFYSRQPLAIQQYVLYKLRFGLKDQNLLFHDIFRLSVLARPAKFVAHSIGLEGLARM